MLDFLFGWRKASKCKKLIRNVQCRLKLLKNRRGSIIRKLREDVAQLLKCGDKQTALVRVERLFKDQALMDAYDLLDHFCEFITIEFPYIRRQRDCRHCPNDINEAVSSLIYAAAKFGDLPELQKLQKLFGERYGHKFAITAAELLVGNLVNCQIIEKLSTKSIPDDVKHCLLDEIARDYNIQRETIRKAYSGQSNLKSCSSSSLSNPSQKLESSCQFSKISAVYLDDIEEFSPTIQDGLGSDQRIFIFKSINMPARDNLGTRITSCSDLYGYRLTDKQIETCEPWDGTARSRNSRMGTKSSRERLNSRSLFWGSQVSHSSASPSLSMNDVESSLFYGDHCDYSSNETPPRRKIHHPKKQQRKISTEESWNLKFRSHKGTTAMKHRSYGDGRDFKANTRGNIQVLDSFPQIDCQSMASLYGITDSKSQMLNMRKMKEEQVEQEVLSDFQSSCATSHASSSYEPSPLTHRFMQPTYMRAQTTPPERSKNTATDKILHSASFEFKQTNHPTGSSSSSSSRHVHPKLPDYDDLKSKFTALKKEHLQRKSNQATSALICR